MHPSPPKRFQMEFTTTSQAVLDTGVKLLVYSEAGYGKTMLTATLPRPLLLSAESGLLSLTRSNIERVFGADRPDICYDIPTIKINSFEDIQQAFMFITNPANNCKDQFDSISLDSLTEIAEQCLNNAKRSVKDPRQAYGELIEKMQTLIRSFRDIPGFNVYMSAKMSRNKDEVTGITAYGPSMPGAKLGPELPYFFDEVFKLAIGKDQQQQDFRYLLTQPDMQNTAKDRSGMLQQMEYPHLGMVINKIKGIAQ
uniref:Sak4-like ssDNA annealing protein n=1 Tax=Klebsiella phage vB_Kpn2-P2 TaxID=3230849 RepID=A0AAU8EEZ1_9VIRU